MKPTHSIVSPRQKYLPCVKDTEHTSAFVIVGVVESKSILLHKQLLDLSISIRPLRHKVLKVLSDRESHTKILPAL